MQIDSKLVAAIRKNHPTGTRIKLIQMDDPQAPPIGTKGTINGVDDVGNILVRWDNGSSLSIIHGVDTYSIIED